jgi:hypothetical protein
LAEVPVPVMQCSSKGQIAVWAVVDAPSYQRQRLLRLLLPLPCPPQSPAQRLMHLPA